MHAWFHRSHAPIEEALPPLHCSATKVLASLVPEPYDARGYPLFYARKSVALGEVMFLRCRVTPNLRYQADMIRLLALVLLINGSRTDEAVVVAPRPVQVAGALHAVACPAVTPTLEVTRPFFAPQAPRGLTK